VQRIAKKYTRLFGKDAIAKIEENPYILMDIVYGVDFKQIDKMAMSLGKSHDDEKRINSSIKYALVLSSYNGHTCVIKENLIKFVIDILSAGAGSVSYEDVENCLINLRVSGDTVQEERERR